jgi:hypothetical protein
MKTIERKKISECKLYGIKSGYGESIQVVVPPAWWIGLSKPTPRISTGIHMPMLELSRANFAKILRAHRKQGRGGA